MGSMWMTSSTSEMRATRDECARQRGGVEAELEYGFLDAVSPEFQCFGDTESPFVVGDVVGNDVDHRHATPLHW